MQPNKRQGFAAGLLNSTSLGSNLQGRTMNMMFFFMNPQQKTALLHLITLIHLICADENCFWLSSCHSIFMVFLGAMDALPGQISPRGVFFRPSDFRPAEELTNLASGLCSQSALGHRASWIFRRDKLGHGGCPTAGLFTIFHNGKSHESG